MTGAIEFLQHLRAWCDNHNYCLDCPYEDTDGDGIVHCKIDGITDKSDTEIADLVREVERWHRERSKDNE